MPDEHPHAQWSVDLSGPPAETLLVAGELVLVPTQEPDPSARRATLHALRLADGAPCWRRSFEYAMLTGLASAPTPTLPHPHTPLLTLVSLTSTDLLRGAGALVALDPAGEERWRWAPGVQRVSAPALVRSNDLGRSGQEATKVATTNAICVTADARTLIVLDLATGTERESVELDASASLSAPAVAGGVAYVPCRGPHLLAVHLGGGSPRRFGGGGGGAWLDQTPVVVGDHVYAVLSTGAVLALRVEDGTQAWRTGVGPAGKPLSAPATDGRRLFAGARDGLHALALADGRELWAFPTERRITAAPIVVGGAVYATCHDHRVYALSATGRELWRHAVGRRIEVPPILATCGEPPAPCVLVADQGGTLTAVARPLSAEEHEAAGHWIEAASAYAALGQPVRGAELLEAHGEPLKAAELWEAAGKQDRAAAQCEAAGAWEGAARLWASLDRPLKQAQALEQHARGLEGTACDAERGAAAWRAAAEAFDAVGEMDRAAACRREVARWLRQPVIRMQVHTEKGLLLRSWSRLQFIVRNEGYGPASRLIIRATGDEFEGQVMDTQRISTLAAGHQRPQWLNVYPLECGDSVPLRLGIEYEDWSGDLRTCEQTIHIPVARDKRDPSAVYITVEGDFIGGDKRTGVDQRGQVIHGPQTNVAGDVHGPLLSGQFQGAVSVGDSKEATERREREVTFLRRQLTEARENLRLIRERKAEYVMETDIPLNLIKQERRLEQCIADLEDKLSPRPEIRELEYNAKVTAPRIVEIYTRFELEAQFLCSPESPSKDAETQSPQQAEIKVAFSRDPRTGRLESAVLRLCLMAPGFRVHGESCKTVEVYPYRNSPRCVFHLEAQRSGLEPVSLEVRQGAHVLGTATLNVEVERATVAKLVLQGMEVSMLLLFAAVPPTRVDV